MKDKEAEVYKKLEDKCQVGYRINELIPFYYPIRQIRLNVLVNKSPDDSLIKVYNVILRAIQLGLNTQNKLFNFLGLNKDDEFIFRELYELREKRYADIVSGKWSVTNAGEEFIRNEKILRIEDYEDFDFFIDGISCDKIMPFEDIQEECIVSKVENNEKQLKPRISLPKKSPELVNEKFSQIDELFKQKNENETLISYEPDKIKWDYQKWCHYWLIEYILESSNTSSDAKLEVRSFNTLKEIKYLTKQFNEEYQDYIYELTDSDRNNEVLPKMVENARLNKEAQAFVPVFETLGIWETRQRFIEALDNVREKLLIESPWIKQATREYIPYFEKILKQNNCLIILYGMADKDEHDIGIVEKLKELQKQYSKFRLIHLPTHFQGINSKFKGTHRKLMIKDNDYYISGSFNFLSFGKQESQKVSNEEAHLITKNVKEKWAQVMKDYSI